MGNAERVEGKSVEELLGALTDSQVGSVAHEQVKAAIQVRIAELQRDTARDSLMWAKVAAVSTAVATVIALVALLVAVLS
jgi:hypothetical protein